MTKRTFLLLFLLTISIGLLVRCSSSYHFTLIEDTGDPEEIAVATVDPFASPVGDGDPIDYNATPTPAPTSTPTVGPGTPTPTPPPTVTPGGPTPTPTPLSGEDTYTQSSTSADVDIIWVIDSSGSMGDNQTAISQNADIFTDRLESTEVDFKLMITTMYPDDPMPSQPSGCDGLTITNANASMFSTCALVGTGDSGYEEGLEALRRALEQNSSFLRSQADLHIFFVSDEEDQPKLSSWENYSSAAEYQTLTSELGAFPNEPPAVLKPGNNRPTGHLADGGHPRDSGHDYVPTVANHVNFLSSLKTGAAKVRTHAIVVGGGDNPLEALNGSDDCHRRNSTEEIAKRYLMVAGDADVGGSHDDICESWTGIMEDLALQATGLESCFGPLAHVPLPGTITVTVNGSSASFTVEWLQGQAKVCPDEIPPANASIVVTYEYEG